MATNDFLPYATAATANVTPQATWAGSTVLSNGQVAGYAKSADNNKAIRQPSFLSAGLAEWVNEQLVTVPILDDGNLTEWVGNLDTALRHLIQSMIRIKATGAVTVYVSANSGNDSNSGLSTAAPFKTIQAGVNYMLNNVDLGPYQATVMIEGGTYNETIYAGGSPLGLLNYNQFQLQSYNGQVAISATQVTFALSGGAQMALNGNFVISCSSVPGGVNAVLSVVAGARLAVLGSGLVFGNSPGCAHVATESGGEFHNGSGNGTYTISGGGTAHLQAGGGGIISVTTLAVSGGRNITLTNSPNFSTAFASCFENSVINVFPNIAFVGTGATGKRYQVSTVSVIGTNGAGVSYLPGNAAGTADAGTGGYYV